MAFEIPRYSAAMANRSISSDFRLARGNSNASITPGLPRLSATWQCTIAGGDFCSRNHYTSHTHYSTQSNADATTDEPSKTAYFNMTDIIITLFCQSLQQNRQTQIIHVTGRQKKTNVHQAGGPY